MLKDVFSFNRTIYDNLTFKDNSISKNNVIKASKYVGAYDIIKHQEKGLDTIILERGNNFSVGERQLLSFARVLLYDPKVMFLDEATANIDTETERLIQKSLDKISHANTMLVLAHRLSTIKNANRILMLLKGKIVEEGSHSELLKNKSYYYNLYKVQYENTEDLKKSAGLKTENK